MGASTHTHTERGGGGGNHGLQGAYHETGSISSSGTRVLVTQHERAFLRVQLFKGKGGSSRQKRAQSRKPSRRRRRNATERGKGHPCELAVAPSYIIYAQRRQWHVDSGRLRRMRSFGMIGLSVEGVALAATACSGERHCTAEAEIYKRYLVAQELHVVFRKLLAFFKVCDPRVHVLVRRC